jgi:O-acetyl-ADP-ribose deacetylase (regulator of RNase III)
VSDLQIILTSMETPLHEAWKELCGHFDFVTVKFGSILDMDCDALVSPANSFGFMDGGIDMAYSRHFGWHVEKRVQEIIQSDFNGELLVGQALIVPTGKTVDAPRPFLIAAPTMRIPMKLPPNTINPYLAAKAVLRCAKTANQVLSQYCHDPKAKPIKTIGFPGLGTGVGGVDPRMCAWQVRQAIEEVLIEDSFFPFAWQDAVVRHKDLTIIGGA